MAQTFREIVGERVQVLRRRKGLSQPALAHETRMGVTTLNRIEKAHTSMSIEKVVALAQALGTSTDYLLGLVNEPDPGSAIAQRVAS